MELLSKRPDHKVIVMRRNNNFAAEDITNDVTIVTTSKKLGNAAGSFSVEMVPFNYWRKFDYAKNLKLHDVILISLDGGKGKGFSKVMICLVGRIAETRKHDLEGRPETRIKLSGLDMGKMLVKHDCGWDIARLDIEDGDAEAIRQMKAERRGSFFQYSGTPAENVKNIMDNLFFPEVGSWVADYIDYSGVVADDVWETFNKTLMEKTGAIWAALKSVANEPWNILYTDTNDRGKFVVHLKQYPFNVEDGSLEVDTVHKIDLNQIFSSDLGVSDSDHTNYVSFENIVNIFGAGEYPITFAKFAKWDEDLVSTFGFRPFKPSTIYAPYLEEKGQDASTKKSDFPPSVEERTNAVWNWHKDVHNYENGYITIEGTPEIRIADGLLITEKKLEYFIEAVQHTYTWGEKVSTYRTTLGLTRGMPSGA